MGSLGIVVIEDSLLGIRAVEEDIEDNLMAEVGSQQELGKQVAC